jgi:antitoxin component YwqK of YwqJK toxin-antitoxin module
MENTMIEYTVEVYEDGSKDWYLNGKLHREDGPAIECADDTKYWFLYGKLHREDGPAIEYANGTKSWYLNGKLLTREEYQSATNPAKELTVAEIEKLLGHRVKIVK